MSNRRNCRSSIRSNKYDEERTRLINIFKQNLKFCEDMKFKVFTPIKYNFTDIRSDLINSCVPFDQPAEVVIENIDSLEMARTMYSTINNQSQVLVLNLASDRKHGGGVWSGSKAQEEDLYRKTNYNEANDTKLYPLKLYDAVYSPLVHIVRDNDFNVIQPCIPISCLAIAAIRNPRTIYRNNEIDYKYQDDYDIMQIKIEMIFQIALKNNHTHLVLGALGCGAFHNPPLEVAHIFKKMIEKYQYHFTKIGFAILCGPNNKNFEIFKNVLSK